ncbi:zinc finger CCCH domain-containing protein 48 isoform X1 [Selaginella moellendorffii]|nr:zinc finger CCCH domain-containing protein 48 isoform X1 [Selaginella moellendorffii]|eukprot:XP_024531223.1 zinc finger CCCH domain-containing protein 48 isoform X1 [Selaginella moellendorffii]
MALSEVLHPEATKRTISRRPMSDRLDFTGQIPRVCKFWQQGRCSKGAVCGFVHGEADSGESAPLALERPSRKRSVAAADPSSSASGSRPVLKKNTWIKEGLADKARVIGFDQTKGPEIIKNKKIIVDPAALPPPPKLKRSSSTEALILGSKKPARKPGTSPSPHTQRACAYWLEGSCRYGERCKFLHAATTVTGLALLTTLKEHKESITGIAMVPDSAVLFTGATDGTLRAWDCNSGTVSDTLRLEGPVEALASGFGWIFAGAGHEVLAWNVKFSQQTLQARAPGNVNALAVGKGLLVAGLGSGEVCAWEFGSGELKSTGTLSKHPSAVTALTVAGGRVYSGSRDGSIRVCEAETGKSCATIVKAHAGELTGLLCWESFLLSCSLDSFIKVWAATPAGTLENYFTFPEGEEEIVGRSGVTGMCGSVDSDGKPVLVCSYRDSTVKVYGLPLFEERGALFSSAEVISLSSAAAGNNLVFSGDKQGAVKVWKWSKDLIK